MEQRNKSVEIDPSNDMVEETSSTREKQSNNTTIDFSLGSSTRKHPNQNMHNFINDKKQKDLKDKA